MYGMIRSTDNHLQKYKKNWNLYSRKIFRPPP